MKTLKYAQDLIKTNNANCAAGFNSFINGYSEPKRSDYANNDEWLAKYQGYQYAKKIAKEDGIAFVYAFKCSIKGCYPFEFGGFFVCNSCGNKNVDKSWWQIQVEKDGNEFCCHGLDFINLQESENYAFGNTFESAIENYHKIMIK